MTDNQDRHMSKKHSTYRKKLSRLCLRLVAKKRKISAGMKKDKIKFIEIEKS